MNEINLKVREREISFLGKNKYAITDNSDYVVKIDFDEEWDQYTTKTVFFIHDNGTYYTRVTTNDECAFPPIVTSTQHVQIGVSAGSVMTTRPLLIGVKNSIKQHLMQPLAEPQTDTYNQIIQLINNIGTTYGNRIALLEEKIEELEGAGN